MVIVIVIVIFLDVYTGNERMCQSKVKVYGVEMDDCCPIGVFLETHNMFIHSYTVFIHKLYAFKIN